MPDIISRFPADEEVHTFYERVRAKENQELELDDDTDSNSSSDEPMDYSQLMTNETFIGDTPYDVIKEGITNQFNDYVAVEDRTNYVDKFYSQLHESYNALDDDEEFHVEEKQEILDKIHDEFIQFMYDEFNQRLSLSLMDIENEEHDVNDIEYSIKILYEFFVINARKNFLNAISRHIRSRLTTVIEDDRQYYNTVRNLLTEYSPIIIANGLGPMEFIAYCKLEDDDQLPSDVISLFNNSRVNGNFLRRYSPKLYQNEDLEVDIINKITLADALRRDLTDGGSNAE